MTIMMQVLMFVSYAVLGSAVWILAPRVFGLGEQLAQLLGVIVFFGAWQVQNLLIVRKVEKENRSRIAVLEDVTTILRGDLERTRRHTKKGDEKSDILVSELKVLHTLLTQVMEREVELKGAGSSKKKASVAPAAQTDEDALALGVDSEPPVRAQADAPSPAAAAEGGTEDETEDAANGDGDAGAPVPDAPAPDGDADLDGEKLDLTPEEAALAEVDDEADEAVVTNESAVTDDGEIAEDAVVSSAGEDVPDAEAKPGRKAEPKGVARRTGAKKKAPIRLIKREDQLLSVIRSSLAENRVDLYLQPVVGLPSRRPAHYECFSRVRDEEGRIILPRQYMKVAESKGLIGTIDNLLLFRLIQLVRRLGRRRPEVRFFCNMSRHSMEDEEFFPQFIDFMTGNEEFRDRLVFEIGQEDYYLLSGDVKDRLMTLGRKGFAFSMDTVKDFNKDFTLLADRKFQYIKADIGDLMASHPEEGDVDAWKSFLRRKGMKLIASRIESEELVLQALEARVELAQGYLFGEPTASNHLGNEF
jgi:cyclic-di-GMP phosphodiesterase TipF (flagellum assembly factor)